MDREDARQFNKKPLTFKLCPFVSWTSTNLAVLHDFERVRAVTATRLQLSKAEHWSLTNQWVITLRCKKNKTTTCQTAFVVLLNTTGEMIVWHKQTHTFRHISQLSTQRSLSEYTDDPQYLLTTPQWEYHITTTPNENMVSHRWKQQHLAISTRATDKALLFII